MMAVVHEKICETCKRSYTSQEHFLIDTYQWRLCSAENLWFNCGCGSTLMLPKGKFSWYSPSIGMSTEAKSVFNRVAEINDLPHIPSAVMEIQRLLRDNEVETSTLAMAIKKAPLLGAEVLRVAENLRNLRERNATPMKSIEHAVTYIGRKSMGDLVLAASIRSFKIETEVFSEEDFWKHAFLTGGIAEMLARKFAPEVDIDKVYLSGSLANLGKIIAALCFPGKLDETQAIVSHVDTMTHWENAEAQTNLDSHCILGEIGATIWGLPLFVIECARNHHTVSLSPTAKTEVPVIVGFANLLAHWVNSEPSRIDNALFQKYLSVFNLTDAALEKFIQQDLAHLK